MRKNGGVGIRLGVFVVSGVLLFMFGLYFIGSKQNLFKKTFPISAVFRNVAGLTAGNSVRLSGINVGVVDNVWFLSDTSVKVDMSIREPTRRYIKKDAAASIGTDGLIGNKLLILTPNPGSRCPVVENYDVLPVTQPINVEETQAQLKTALDNAVRITEDMAIIMHQMRLGQGVAGRLLMDSTAARNFDSTLSSLKKGMESFPEIMKKARKSIFLKGF